MFTNTYLPHIGGVAKSVDTFQADLIRLGHQVLVIAPEYRASAEEPPNVSANVVRLPAIQNFNGSDFSVRIPVPFFIDEKIDGFQPDIVHSHHPYLLGDTALRVAKKRRLPIIFTHHTLYEEYIHYISSGSETLRQFVTYLSTEYANLCDRVIVPSGSVAELIRGRGVVRPIIEIPTGVDLVQFRRANAEEYRSTHGLPKDSFVIGHVGRLAPEKNIGFLSAAVAESMRKIESARFLIVGSGPGEKELKRWFASPALVERIIMAGNQTGQELVDAYHAMDVFVFSSHTETQGMVLAEAMAAGTPVIALNASGVREVLQDNYNGRMLDHDASPTEFAEAIHMASRTPESLATWSQNARTTVARLDRIHCAQKLLGVYQIAVAERLEAEKDKNRNSLEINFLEDVRQRLVTEWELAAEKLSALVQAVKETE